MSSFAPRTPATARWREAIAAQGTHMVTEKPMSATLADALRMGRAVQANDVALLVNWPTTWSPAIRTVKGLIDEGVIGDVLEVKWRNGASMGPLAYTQREDASGAKRAPSGGTRAAPGGGVLLDYCCYGACLSRWFIGEPAVAARASRPTSPARMATPRTTPSSPCAFPRPWPSWRPPGPPGHAGIPTGPIVYGTEGALVATSRDHKPVVEVYTSRAHGAQAPDQVL